MLKVQVAFSDGCLAMFMVTTFHRALAKLIHMAIEEEDYWGVNQVTFKITPIWNERTLEWDHDWFEYVHPFLSSDGRDRWPNSLPAKLESANAENFWRSMEQFLVGSRWPKVLVHIRFPEHTDQRYINFTMWAISKIIQFVYWTIKANKIRS
jgi:hypothetical protein